MTTSEKIMHNISEFFDSSLEILQSVLPNLLLIILAIVIAIILGFLFRIIARITKLDRWLEKRTFFQPVIATKGGTKTHVFVGRVVFVLVLVFSLDLIASLNGWATIKDSFVDFSTFLPSLITALLIVAVGAFLAKYIQKSAELILEKTGAKYSKLLSKVAYYALMILVLTLALNRLGLDTSIITANATIILASLLLAFSVSFVFASKDILTNILSSSYNKSNYKVGQQILVNGIKGEIIKITNLSIYVKTTNNIKVIPARKFTEEIVDIIGD